MSTEARPVPLENRDPRFPGVSEVDSHPKVSGNHGRIFIFHQDLSEEGLETTRTAAWSTAAPQSIKEAESKGFPVLDPDNGDCGFLRNTKGNGDPMHDSRVALTVNTSFYPPQVLKDLENMQNRVIGNPNDLRREGRIAYELLERATPNDRGNRCYNAGTSFQKPKQLTAPAATMKAGLGSMDLPMTMIQTAASCAILGLRKKAPEILNLMDAMAAFLNTPRIGVDENTCYPSMQLNVAPAVEAKDRTAEGEVKSLGQAGKPHYDEQDSHYALTCMLNLSRSHPDVEPEIFTVLGLGFSCRLPELSSLYFSGLYLHSGTQPVYSTPRTVDVDYCRVTLICYPPRNLLHNHGSLALAAAPKTSDFMDKEDIEKAAKMDPPELTEFLENYGSSSKGLMTHFSEMRGKWYSEPGSNPLPSTGQATFLRDGACMMKKSSYASFAVASILQQAAFLLSQSDPACDIQFTPGMFFNAFTYRDETGKRLPVRHSILNLLKEPEYQCTPFSQETKEKHLAILRQSETEWTEAYEAKKAEIGKLRRVNQKGTSAKKNRNGNNRNNPKKSYSSALNDPGGDEAEYSLRSSGRKRKQGPTGGTDPGPQRKNPKRGKGKAKANTPMPPSDDDSPTSQPTDPLDDHMDECNDDGNHQSIYDASSRKVAPDSTPSASPRVPALSLLDIEDSCRSFGSPFMSQTPAVGSELESLRVEESLPQGLFELLEYLSSHVITSTNTYDTIDRSRRVTSFKNLMINLILWEVLEREAQASRNRHHPLHGLRIRIEDAFQMKNGTILQKDIHPRFTTFNCNMEEKYEYTLISYRTRDKGSVYEHLSIDDQMVHILGYFYRIPLESRYRAILTREVVQELGPVSLLLNSVADFLQMSPYHSLGLLTQPSPIFVRKACSSVTSKIMADATDLESIRERMGALQTMAENKFPGLRMLFIAATVTREPAIGPPCPSESPSTKTFKSRSFGRFQNASHPGIWTLALLIHLLLPLVDSKETSDLEPQHRAFLNWVNENTDSRLPFRDCADSRRRILETNGPFSPENATTPRGFFSALIFRGVTFSTKFLRDEKTMFADFNDWKHTYYPLVPTKDDKYFCKKNAYGACAGQRDPNNVRQYWRAAQDTRLRPTQGMPFSTFFKNIRKSQNTPAFGDLTTFLLAADYASANVIQVPSSEEAGRLVHKINSGSKDGLEMLEYRCSSMDETSAAFTEVKDALETFLTKEEKEKAGFSVFFVEHVLCKLSRFKNIPTFRTLCEAWDVPLPVG